MKSSRSVAGAVLAGRSLDRQEAGQDRGGAREVMALPLGSCS